MSRHTDELRARTPSELQGLLQQTQDQFSTLRFQLTNRQSTDTAQLRTLRHEIARIKTLLREDQLRREAQNG
jgi:large subunit ribosomal protein L29